MQFNRNMFVLSALLISVIPASAQTWTVDFDTLATPAVGTVGPAQRVYQEYGPDTFTLIRIADAGDPSTYGNHFHTVVGNGSPGHSNTTAAEFFSDDGSPFLYFLGNYTGTTNSTYAPDWASARDFSLVSFNVLSLEGTYRLTASNGSMIDIDHTGVYSGLDVSGFQNIQSFQHDYTGATDGSMVIDDIQVQAAPEPATLAVVGLGIAAFFKRRRKA